MTAAWERAAGGLGRHDPFAVDEHDDAIEALRVQWGSHYDIGVAGGCWLAIRNNAGNDAEPLSADTPGALSAAIAADWAAGSGS